MSTFTKTLMTVSVLFFLILTLSAGYMVFQSHSISSESRQVPLWLKAQSSQSNLSLVYPDSTLANFQNASSLCGMIARGLGTSQLIPSSTNSHNLPNASDEAGWSNPAWSTVYSYPCYNWWGWGSNGLTIGALYNKWDQLVEVKVSPASYSWVSNSTSAQDILFAARTLAHSIGIPDAAITNKTIIYDGNGTNAMTGQVTDFQQVLLSSPVGGLHVDGANCLYVHFENTNIWKIDLSCFYSAPPIQTVPKAAAVSAAAALLQREFNKTGNLSIISGPSVRGLVLDQDSMTVAYSVYAYLVPDTSHPEVQGGAEVLVNVETGVALSYYSAIYDINSNKPEEIGPGQNGGNPAPIVRLPGGSWSPALAVGLGAFCAAIGAVFVLAWPAEVFVIPFLTLLAPLYSRLQKDELLENYRRGMIHGLVLAHPGISFSEIRKALSISNGSLVYHLKVLQDGGEICGRKSGSLMRYYVNDTSVSEIARNGLTDLRIEIVKHISARGQSSKPEIQRSLSASRQTVHYNVRKLVTDKILVRSFLGGRRIYRIAPGVDTGSVSSLHEDREHVESGTEVGNAASPDEQHLNILAPSR